MANQDREVTGPGTPGWYEMVAFADHNTGQLVVIGADGGVYRSRIKLSEAKVDKPLTFDHIGDLPGDALNRTPRTFDRTHTGIGAGG